MTFKIVHPSIVNLYVNALTLHLLQEKLSNIGPDGLTKDIETDVEIATSEFYDAAQEAERLLGNSEAVQCQLDMFSAHEGDA